MRIIDVPVEPLVSEASKPFGRVIERNIKTADFESSPNRMMNLGFEVDGHAELYLIRYLRRDMLVSRFERHLTMTEARISLGEPAVVLVAADTALGKPIKIPDPNSARAFLIKGGQGFMFHRGTWHSLDCYPTAAEFADFAFFTEREAEQELLALQESDPSECKRSHIIDFTKAHNVTFRIVDPMDLITTGSF